MFDLKWKMLAIIFCLAVCTLYVERGRAQSGVLVPSSRNAPDDGVLALAAMNVDVLVDNNHARVRVRQVFGNRTADVLEGKYLFALPPSSLISDFAVWDGDTRIPGVVMERRRANAVYADIKRQIIDPGILQSEEDDHGAFSAKVFPIPAYGTKRVELEYTEMLSIESLTAHFAFPLKPSDGKAQRVGDFSLHVRVMNDAPFTIINRDGTPYSLTTLKQDANEYEASFSARDIKLTDDFALDYKLNIEQSRLAWLAYRAPERITAYDLRDPATANPRPDGYFQATALFNEAGTNDRDNRTPRNVVLLLDTSLSMHGEKLRRAVEASEFFLSGLTPQDTFNLLLFNDETSALSHDAMPATPEAIEQAANFIRTSTLGGGTDIWRALNTAAELAARLPTGNRSVVVISDFNPTLGTVDLKKIISAFKRENELAAPPRVFAFALGTDANQTLLRELTQVFHGYFAHARETEDVSAQLRFFFDKVGRASIENIRYDTDDDANFYHVYPTATHSFDGSSFSFIGRYRQPRPATTVRVSGVFGANNIDLAQRVMLPKFDDIHAHLPRVWAQARVAALLDEMNVDGEREDLINEIISLAQKYKFVTPYTAFVAAPRALLRPRLIQPGDPVIRVKTDPSVTSVFAVLPFGETLPLRFLQSEGMWETRFLAPAWMQDGTYSCRLLLADEQGQAYEEMKSFVIDSRAPRLRVSPAKETVQAGGELRLRVAADKDTVRLIAKLYGASPVSLRWSDAEQSNVGTVHIPASLAAGQYTLIVTAEDAAHNETKSETRINVTR